MNNFQQNDRPVKYGVSLFDKANWIKFLPKDVTIITSNGTFTLKFSEDQNSNKPGVLTNSGPDADITVMGNGEQIQIEYIQHTPTKTGDVNSDGEPDFLEFDISVVNNNDGYKANPDDVKLNVSISYGDTYVSQFVIRKPGNVKVVHYTGINSLYDKDTKFSFDDKTLKSLIRFFNCFGYNLNLNDFDFLDSKLDNFSYEDTKESLNLLPSFGNKFMLVIDNTLPDETKSINNITNYLKNRGVNYKLASTVEDLKANLSTDIMGCIASGTQKKITDSDDANHPCKHALQSLKCPILGVSYGMNFIGKENGANLATLDKVYNNSNSINDFDREHPLFKGIDLSKTQNSFEFNEFLQDCPNGFKTIAKLNDKIVGISNDTKKHYGLLFNPEDIEDTFGILDNFLTICTGGKCDDAESLMGNQANEFQGQYERMKYLKTYENFRKL